MEVTIDETLARMVDAWDAGDASAYAEQFTADATYVIFAGALSRGCEQIRRDHESLFAGFLKGSRMRMEVTDVRSLGDDVAVVVSEGGVGKGRSIPLDKVQTFVFRRQDDGRWLCEAFQNTKKNRLMLWLASRSAH